MNEIDADAVLDAPLLTLAGASTALRAELGGGTLVAVFVRHFG
jgi:hypothetical protein